MTSGSTPSVAARVPLSSVRWAARGVSCAATPPPVARPPTMMREGENPNLGVQLQIHNGIRKAPDNNLPSRHGTLHFRYATPARRKPLDEFYCCLDGPQELASKAW